MMVFIRPTGAPLGQTLGFGPNGSSASLDTAAVVPSLATGDMVLMQRAGALVKIMANALGVFNEATGATLLAANGLSQGLYLAQLYGTSAAGTAVRLTADGNPAGAGNSWPVATGNAVFGDVRVLAVNVATLDVACWSLTLAAKNPSGTVAVVTPGSSPLSPTYSSGGMASATLTVSADTVNGAISLIVTPPASVVASCQASFSGPVN